MSEQLEQDKPVGKGPGKISRWVQRRANARTVQRIRRKGGRMMAMDVLILHTRGRVSGQPRETPLAWFDGGTGSWLVVGSGGGDRHPDWYWNLIAQPDSVAVEFHGRDPQPVTPHELRGAEREEAWRKIASAQPRIAKYQSKAVREYPVIRLTAK